MPGPGSYNIRDKKDPPYKGKFPNSKREPRKGLNVPGPGTYDAKPQFPGPEAHKIQRRYEEKIKNNTPGPGYYKNNQNKL